MPFIAPHLLGLSGAPCTGKTTLAAALCAALNARGLDASLLPEPARLLAKRGVRIDAAMKLDDYEAFLRAYAERDADCPGLGVADRTLADHYSYLAANPPLPAEFLARHRAAALNGLRAYRAVLYLPPELPLVDDAFRVLDPAYRATLDCAIVELLGQADVAVITVAGDPQARLEAALAVVREYWPEQFAAGAAAGSGGL